MTSAYFDEFFYAVHGFRMPLFFLLSGFFTAMLWRRRGLSSLVRHRIRRIALPLAIGMVTVVPAVNWSIEWAIDNGVADYVDESGDIWAAAFLGNERAVEVLLDRGVDVNAPNVAGNGDTPLHVAAYVGDADIVELLLDRGADPNSTAPGGTPIEYAVFVGSEDVANLLVGAGAPDLRAPGTDWQDISFWGEGAEQAAQDRGQVRSPELAGQFPSSVVPVVPPLAGGRVRRGRARRRPCVSGGDDSPGVVGLDHVGAHPRHPRAPAAHG